MILLLLLFSPLSHAWLSCDSINGSLPGSPTHGIFQTRILEWVAISFSGASSPPRDGGGFLTTEPPGKPNDPVTRIHKELFDSTMWKQPNLKLGKGLKWTSLVAQLVRIRLQCGRPGFDPWVETTLCRRERVPTPVFWPGEVHRLYSA